MTIKQLTDTINQIARQERHQEIKDFDLDIQFGRDDLWSISTINYIDKVIVIRGKEHVE